MTFEFVFGVIALGLTALLFRHILRVASRPRKTPKIPRDRRYETQVQPVIWFRLF